MNARDVMRDPKLLGGHFVPVGSWAAQFAFVAATLGLPMTDAEAALYRQHTGRAVTPNRPAREAYLIAGRRAGKSRIGAFLAVYLAIFKDYSRVLAAGERGTVMLIAADRRQARVVFRYVEALLESTSLLANEIESRTADSIDLKNRITIEVHTPRFRGVRGYTLIAAILDELAFWRDESSADPDVEILAALRPGLATVPGALLIGISSPYARRGVLWDMHRRHYGVEGDPVLVWKAPTAAMNPSVDPEVIAQAYAEDEPRARAEYGAEFRSDVEAFLSREAVEAVTVPGRRELPRIVGVSYAAFVDPSGGSNDAMTLAIAHDEDGRAVLDLVREVKPPFSPQGVVADFAGALRAYGISEVTGDRYGAEWVAERFRSEGIAYRPAEKAKSDLYREILPAINSRRVELLEHGKLVAQLCGLERRTARGGRDTIDHAPGAHDDVANAVAGALHRVLRGVDWWGALYGEQGLYVELGKHEAAGTLDAWLEEFGGGDVPLDVEPEPRRPISTLHEVGIDDD